VSQLLTESRTSSWCSRLGILSQAAPAFFCPRALSPRGWLSALWGRTFRRGVGSRDFGGRSFAEGLALGTLGAHLSPRGWLSALWGRTFRSRRRPSRKPRRRAAGLGRPPNLPCANLPDLCHANGLMPPKFGCRQCVSMAAIGLRVMNGQSWQRRRLSPRRGVGSRHFASTPLGRDLTPRGNPQDARTPKPHNCGP